MASSVRDLCAGDEIQLLSGEWVRLVADPRPSVYGRYVLEYESLSRLPNGMTTKNGVITGVQPAELPPVRVPRMELSEAA